MQRLLQASKDDWIVRVRVRGRDGTERTRKIGVNHHNSQEAAIALARLRVRPPRKAFMGLADEILDMDIRRRWEGQAVAVGV